jgi:hypothetical protein
MQGKHSKKAREEKLTKINDQVAHYMAKLFYQMSQFYLVYSKIPR